MTFALPARSGEVGSLDYRSNVMLDSFPYHEHKE